MAFINKSDLIQLAILEEELKEITRNDDLIITACCSEAQSEIKIALYDSYDVDFILARTGSARHGVLLGLGADIAIYLICRRCQAGQDLGDREKRYERAVSMLKGLKKSETYSDLPRRTQPLQNHINFQSNPKRGNYY